MKSLEPVHTLGPGGFQPPTTPAPRRQIPVGTPARTRSCGWTGRVTRCTSLDPILASPGSIGRRGRVMRGADASSTGWVRWLHAQRPRGSRGMSAGLPVVRFDFVACTGRAPRSRRDACWVVQVAFPFAQGVPASGQNLICTNVGPASQGREHFPVRALDSIHLAGKCLLCKAKPRSARPWEGLRRSDDRRSCRRERSIVRRRDSTCRAV